MILTPILGPILRPVLRPIVGLRGGAGVITQYSYPLATTGTIWGADGSANITPHKWAGGTAFAVIQLDFDSATLGVILKSTALAPTDAMWLGSDWVKVNLTGAPTNYYLQWDGGLLAYIGVDQYAIDFITSLTVGDVVEFTIEPTTVPASVLTTDDNQLLTTDNFEFLTGV